MKLLKLISDILVNVELQKQQIYEKVDLYKNFQNKFDSDYFLFLCQELWALLQNIFR